jgi:hypothetical protein
MKNSFEKFAAHKIQPNQLNSITGGGSPTTYNRADFGTGKTGTGNDIAHGDGCMEYVTDSVVECGIPGA